MRLRSPLHGFLPLHPLHLVRPGWPRPDGRLLNLIFKHHLNSNSAKVTSPPRFCRANFVFCSPLVKRPTTGTAIATRVPYRQIEEKHMKCAERAYSVKLWSTKKNKSWPAPWNARCYHPWRCHHSKVVICYALVSLSPVCSRMMSVKGVPTFIIAIYSNPLEPK